MTLSLLDFIIYHFLFVCCFSTDDGDQNSGRRNYLCQAIGPTGIVPDTSTKLLRGLFFGVECLEDDEPIRVDFELDCIFDFFHGSNRLLVMPLCKAYWVRWATQCRSSFFISMVRCFSTVLMEMRLR